VERIPLFDFFASIRLIQYCKLNDVAILGIEGFEVKGANRIPNMDWIIDFSALLDEEGFVEKSSDESIHIFESLIPTDLLFEFVLLKLGTK